MPPALEDVVGDLVRQARRLRFSDPVLEARFRHERLTAGEVRARVMAIVAVAIVGINGWNDAKGLGRVIPFAELEDLRLRFFVMVPAFLAIAISPGIRGHAQRADVVNATAIVAVCWANALIYWHVALSLPGTAFASSVLGSVLPILVISVFGLPLGFRAMLGMVLAVVAGIVGWFAATLGPDYARGVSALAISLPLMCVAAALLGWWRERGERTMFAQREQVQQLAKKLEVANATLARVNAEQTTFMGIAAHDLRAPLATVRGFAELLRSGRLPAGEAQQNALKEIEAQSARMLALVSDYLGAHAAAGRAETPQLARLDVCASARAAMVRHTPAALAKGQTLTLAASDTASWASADEARLAQVVDNFAVNALKFSPRGFAVKFVVAARDGAVRFAVIDTGPGIAVDEQAGLFRMFGRSSARPTDGEPSHGFGLAVAKRLAESMGAMVGCESELGHGATFWIELPAAT